MRKELFSNLKTIYINNTISWFGRGENKKTKPCFLSLESRQTITKGLRKKNKGKKQSAALL